MKDTQWAGTEEDMKSQRILEVLKRRKIIIDKKLWSKRAHPSQSGQKTLEMFSVKEEPEKISMETENLLLVEEEKKEETKVLGHLDLNQHYKKRVKLDKKKCWICKSKNHLKKRCPKLRCFWCHKLGHLKANCFHRKMNFIFNRLLETYGIRERKKIERKKEQKMKKEQKELEKKIIELRASKLEFYLRQTEKGEIFSAKWNNKEIGDYIGPGLPSKTIENIRQHRYKTEYLNVLTEKDIPHRDLILYDGLSNWCGCGVIDMGKNFFINHVNEHHKGIILKNSQLNRPPWLDFIKFKSDQLEEDFCFTLSNLNNLS